MLVSSWRTRSSNGKTSVAVRPVFADSALFTLTCAFRAESLLNDRSRLALLKDPALLCGADIGMGIQLGRLDFLNRGRN